MDDSVKQAIEVAGGTAALALRLGIQAPSIYSWRRVPAIRVLAVEAVTGISRHDLRPDLYPRESPVRATAPKAAKVARKAKAKPKPAAPKRPRAKAAASEPQPAEAAD